MRLEVSFSVPRALRRFCSLTEAPGAYAYLQRVTSEGLRACVELELELVLTHMTQKPVLRVGVCARA